MKFDNYFTRRFLFILAISFIMLLVLFGISEIRNSGLQMPVPVVALIFAIGFIIGTVLSEHRDGIFPWILLGGVFVAVITTVAITCVYSGMVFVFSGGLSTISIDILIYLLSGCMIASVIAMDFISNWISQQEKEELKQKCIIENKPLPPDNWKI